MLLNTKRVWIVMLALFVFCLLCYDAAWQEKMQTKLSCLGELRQAGVAVTQAKQIMQESKCFPVRATRSGESWGFEDGYGAKRTYGGDRQHEGIDIMAIPDQPGNLQVVAVCDGVIEQKGWLRLGGYRIGIRSANGLYYYYAHLDHYAKDIKTGDRVRAGQCIGYVGNTGYGKEGTRGKFASHLHFGIYYDTAQGETSLNPYPLLRYLED